jgi:hypothetical protein
LDDLADREINHGLDYFFDTGWTVWIGDGLTSVFARATFDSLDDVVPWLLEKARQFERRNSIRVIE